MSAAKAENLELVNQKSVDEGSRECICAAVSRK
jgi:hypothetical protein